MSYFSKIITTNMLAYFLLKWFVTFLENITELCISSTILKFIFVF